MAVFKTARRLSEVDVVTELRTAENSQCTRPSRSQSCTVALLDSRMCALARTAASEPIV